MLFRVCARVLVVMVVAVGWLLSRPLPSLAGGSPLRDLEMGTASIGGAFYVVGTAIARELEAALRIPVVASVT